MSSSPSRRDSRYSVPDNASPEILEQQLTPRSKVKAMLAVFNESSEEELARPVKRRIVPQNNTIKPDSLDSSEGVNDSDTEATSSRPRGKLAARLYGSKPTGYDTKATVAQDGAVTTYERVRQQLAGQITEEKEPVDGSSSSEQPEIAPGLMKKKLLQKKKIVFSSPRTSSPTNNAAISEGTQDGATLTPTKPIAIQPTLLLTPPQQATGKGSSLFLTPDNERTAVTYLNDADLPMNTGSMSRFEKLVAQKRKEREAKEAAEEAKRAERIRRQSRNSDIAELFGDNEDSEGDVAAGEKLTQQSKPTRKASKKALEEMTRETQRMNRNMQLAHQAKTKMKISKQSFLERFNFRKLPLTNATSNLEASSSSTITSSAPASDVEGAKEQQTPPTNPLEHHLAHVA